MSRFFIGRHAREEGRGACQDFETELSDLERYSIVSEG